MDLLNPRADVHYLTSSRIAVKPQLRLDSLVKQVLLFLFPSEPLEGSLEYVTLVDRVETD